MTNTAIICQADSITIDTIGIYATSKNHITFEQKLNQPSQIILLDNLIQKQTSAFIKSYGAGSISTLSLRGGSSQQNIVQWEGININNPMLGLNDLSLIPTYAFNKIELLKGGLSSTHGSGAITGVVKLENTFDFAHPISGNLAFDYGSFGKKTISNEVSLFSKKLAAKASYFNSSAVNNFPYINNAGTKKVQSHAYTSSEAINLSMLFFSKSKSTLKADFWHQNTFRQTPPTTTQNTSKSDLTDIIYRYKIKYSWHSKNLDIDSHLAYLDEQNNFRDSINFIFTNNRFNTIIHKSDLTYTLGENHIIKGAYNFSNVTAKTEAYESDENIKQLAILTEYQYTHKKSFFLIAINQTWRSHVKLPFAPTFSYTYKIKTNQSIQVKLSREFRAPTANELFWRPGGNVELRPETGWNQELNFYQEFSKKHNLQIALFHRKINNWILWALDPNLNFYQASNISSVRSYGLDFVFNMQIKTGLIKHSINSNYSYTISKNLVDIEQPLIRKGSQLIYTPKHKVALNYNLNYKNWSLILSSQYVSDTRGILDSLDAYNLLDLSLIKNIKLSGHTIDLQFQVYNILNHNYRVIERRPMPGRHYELGIRLNLFS